MDCIREEQIDVELYKLGTKLKDQKKNNFSLNIYILSSFISFHFLRYTIASFSASI